MKMDSKSCEQKWDLLGIIRSLLECVCARKVCLGVVEDVFDVVELSDLLIDLSREVVNLILRQ